MVRKRQQVGAPSGQDSRRRAQEGLLHLDENLHLRLREQDGERHEELRVHKGRAVRARESGEAQAGLRRPALREFHGGLSSRISYCHAIFQIHDFDWVYSLDQLVKYTIPALVKLKEQGKIRYPLRACIENIFNSFLIGTWASPR